MSSAVPSLEAIRYVVTLLGKTEARDKINKLVQYGCKALGHVVAARGLASTARRLRLLEGSLSQSRKVFRLAKPLAFVDKLNTSLASSDPAVFFLGSASALGFMSYLTLDALIWLVKIKVLERPAAARMQYWASVCWAVALAAGATLEHRKFSALCDREQRLAVTARDFRTDGDEAGKSDARKELDDVRGKKKESILAQVRQHADLQVALSGVIAAYNPSPAFLGLCGMTSAALSLRTML